MSLTAEEAARADLYAVLARLFQAPPDAPLLAALAASADRGEEGEVGRAWGALARAAAVARPEAVKEEYDAVFVGTGKAPVSLYTSAYTIRYSSETPLAALRGDLAALGFAKRIDATEPEDHVGVLCEVMRALILGEKHELEEQRRFFERWLWPAIPGLCAAIDGCEQVRFYETVAALLLAICTVEHTSFEML